MSKSNFKFLCARWGGGDTHLLRASRVWSQKDDKRLWRLWDTSKQAVQFPRGARMQRLWQREVGG